MFGISPDKPKADSVFAELPPLPIGALVAGLLDLLKEASDLPQPHCITVGSTAGFELHFAQSASCAADITLWAFRFGGVLVGTTHEGDNGPEKFYTLDFSYYGVPVTAFAIIPA